MDPEQGWRTAWRAGRSTQLRSGQALLGGVWVSRALKLSEAQIPLLNALGVSQDSMCELRKRHRQS